MALRSTYRRCRFWQKKIIFLDEVHFDLGGYVNKQNCRIWRTENPHACIEKLTRPKQVTVWCRFCSRGIIGPFVFENAQGDRYQAMLYEFLFTKIEEEDIDNIWFQPDGHTATLDVLHPVFEDRIISCRADVVWPPRSCDLRPLHYYSWSTVKDKCYTDKPETIDALKFKPQVRIKTKIWKYFVGHFLWADFWQKFWDQIKLPWKSQKVVVRSRL